MDFNFSCKTSDFELVFSLFELKKNVEIFSKVPSLVSFMPKPLKVHSLSRYVPNFLAPICQMSIFFHCRRHTWDRATS